MYELFIEGQKADINDQISVQLTFAIDDVANFASRETSFSKQIVLPGTAANHYIFGHVYEMGSNNPFSPGQPNIGAAFNVAQTSRAELRLNGLLVLRGVFRLTGIIKDGDFVEYEGALFGELSGLMSQISNQKLEDLDFSAYDHTLTHTAISNSWDNTPGSGYFYPLIDYGNYRETNNSHYNIGTFRPALYAKEYLDKMFSAAGYTYQSTFINSAYFKSLIIPHNQSLLTKLIIRQLTATRTSGTFTTIDEDLLSFQTAVGGNFTIPGTKDEFTYNSATSVNVTGEFKLKASYTVTVANTTEDFSIILRKNQSAIATATFNGPSGNIDITMSISGIIVQNDVIDVLIRSGDPKNSANINLSNIVASIIINATSAQVTPINTNDTVIINDAVPKGIFQKDFFASLVKMFNLYIWEDKLDEKKLYIEPYIDYMSATQLDWTYKVARDKSWQISPMGNLNGRIFEYKYKEDVDYYNESYKKKFNQSYADCQFDTGFQFSQDRQITDIIFASSPLLKYGTNDKYVTPIYKKSNELAAEDRMDSNIRILFSKKKSASTWDIKDTSGNHAKTFYGYAGHLDDPTSPQYDLNFGAPSETYFTPTTYPSANLFNRYWSDYIAQIADKDSKILKCHVYLRPVDIAQLDFAKPIFIDGVLFRLNKILDYDYTNNELVQVELIKYFNYG